MSPFLPCLVDALHRLVAEILFGKALVLWHVCSVRKLLLPSFINSIDLLLFCCFLDITLKPLSIVSALGGSVVLNRFVTIIEVRSRRRFFVDLPDVLILHFTLICILCHIKLNISIVDSVLKSHLAGSLHLSRGSVTNRKVALSSFVNSVLHLLIRALFFLIRVSRPYLFRFHLFRFSINESLLID